MTDPVTLTGSDGAPYLAVDVIPDESGDVFVLDASELDGYDELAWGTLVGWVNVVCDVTAVSIRRGSTRLQGVQSKAEAGEASVTLLDSARRFDPMVNADAIHAGTPLRLRAWSYDGDGAPWEAVLFTGTIEDVPVTYPRTGPPVVTLTATDVIGALAQWAGPGYDGAGIGQGDNLRGRLLRILAETGLGADRLSTDSDTTFAATLAPTTLPRPWQDLSAAVDAELGRLWVNSADQLVIRGRGAELSGTLRGTLSDAHGETINGAPHCCLEDVSATLGTENLVNLATAERRIPDTDADPRPVSATARAVDTYSQGRYGVRSLPANPTVLELDTDDQLQAWVDTVVTAGSTPDLRVDTVQPAPSPVDLDSALTAWPAVCATDLGDRWLLRLRPESGPELARTVGVLGIAWDLTPEGWSVTWTTTEAPTPGEANPSGWFALELSELDGGDVLSPTPGPVPVPGRDQLPDGVIDGGTAAATGPDGIDGGTAW